MKRTITITGEIDEIFDGFSTNIELYTHIYVLVIALVKSHVNGAWKSRKSHDGIELDGIFFVGLELPSGIVSYEMPLDKFWDQLEHVKELEFAPKVNSSHEENIVKITKWIGL